MKQDTHHLQNQLNLVYFHNLDINATNANKVCEKAPSFSKSSQNQVGHIPVHFLNSLKTCTQNMSMINRTAKDL